MKPYFVWLGDCFILGPTVSFEMGTVRVGLSLISFEIGLAFESKKVYSFGCHSCGAIGYAKVDELPPGWEKRYRPDNTYYFLCLKCRGFEVDEDYLITDENRERAVDEITGQLAGDSAGEVEIKALRDYANRLLDESAPFAKYDLSASVAAYSDGFTDARALAGQ